MQVNYERIRGANFLANVLNSLENDLHEITHADSIQIKVEYMYRGKSKDFYAPDISIDEHVEYLKKKIEEIKKQIEEL
mgnify:FL=1